MDVPETAAAFRAEGLVKHFGARRALDGVGMEVAPGTAMGLAGANGAGKTTFIKCALDLCAADAGRVEIFGMDSRQAAARAAGLCSRALRAAVLPSWPRVSRHDP